MAQKVQVLLFSDLDGEPADETVRFALDGSSYEIDLSGPDARALREIFAPYGASARKVSASARGTRGLASAPGPERGATQRVREWARENGYDVSERGRISSRISEAYRRATS